VSHLRFWVAVNGQSLLKTEAECRLLPASTQAMTEDQKSGWQALSVLIPTAFTPGAGAVAPAAGGRADFQRPAQHAPAGGAAASTKSLFAGVEGADVIRRGVNMNEGKYIAKLCAAEFINGRKGDMVVLEVEILTSSYDAANPTTHSCNQEGTRANIYIKKNDNWLSNIKEVVLAASGFDKDGKARPVDDTVTQAECDGLISAAQPFTGALVYLEAKLVKTKAGGDFTRISWWPCPIQPDGTPDINKLMREVR
jgi:hypothetical protein